MAPSTSACWGREIPGDGATGGSVKIATFNVNGVNGRLPVLLRWLAAAEPDVVCLQELKAQHCHVWTALADQGLFWTMRWSWVRSCLRPLTRRLNPRWP